MKNKVDSLEFNLKFIDVIAKDINFDIEDAPVIKPKKT